MQDVKFLTGILFAANPGSRFYRTSKGTLFNVVAQTRQQLLIPKNSIPKEVHRCQI